ncbi:transcriptional regulator [Pseudomonas cavernicola]|uniref:Transcriptional regulator n=1 Tax=Pseudomonas cavernicola TaxID=2320866 RepID=A0A418X8Z4_9PSED|nr:histone-like nucleoid-structuring protein, MvaT/MvaU family [Pseudomonas cavernicola]RJG08959.1 transcriptional regulator [Pseudomonas cavernicola]
MSKLAEYRALEQQLAEQLAELEAMKNDKRLNQEMEFERKLRQLMDGYGKKLGDIIAILQPPAGRTKLVAPAKAKRRERQVKRYKNPHTNEVVETKGGNHKVLKVWKQEYGAAVVDSWLQ